jgi:hypothetical protein
MKINKATKSQSERQNEQLKKRYAGRKFYRPATGQMEEVNNDFAEELRKSSELLRRER